MLYAPYYAPDLEGIAGLALIPPVDLKWQLASSMTTKAWAGFETWDCMFAENSLNSTSVKRITAPPILFVIGENDELVDPEEQRASFDQLCDQGYQLDYLECQGAGHSEAVAWSLPEQFVWVEARARRLTVLKLAKAAAG